MHRFTDCCLLRGLCDCDRSRMETARVKADETEAVASKAHSDAAIARQKAAEFEHIELHVGTSQYIALISTLRSVSMFIE